MRIRIFMPIIKGLIFTKSKAPLRPSFPILLLVALVIWAGLAIYFYFFSTLEKSYLPSEEIKTPISSFRTLAMTFFSNYCGGEAGLLQALVCGDKEIIKADGNYENFKICGLAHIVAVSGAHLSIVVAMLLFVLKFIKVGKRGQIATCVLFVAFYLCFTNLPISAIRSGVMVILALLGPAFGRRSHSLNALAIALLGFFVTDPSSALDVSLFLSASSTLGIILFARLVESWLGEKSPSALSAPIALTLSANLMTMPFSIGLFSQVSMISIAANVITAPLFSLACVAGLACALLAIALAPLASFAANVFGTVAGLSALPLRLTVDALSLVPYASIAVSADPVLMVILSVALAALLYFAWPSFSVLTVILFISMLTLSLFFFPGPGDGVVMLNVGQGDAILVKSAGHAVLVDTGNKPSKLRRALGREGVRTLDAVIVTHHDDDHMGCLEELGSYIQFSRVLVAKEALTCDCESCVALRDEASLKSIEGLEVGDCIKVGEFKASVLWPKEFSNEGGNEDSLVLKVETDALSLLLTGDCESEELEQLKAGDIDILKVGHHGSKTSLSKELLQQLKPEVALISVGAKNRYGHPTEEALSLLNEYGVKVFRTDENGEIRISGNQVTCDTL